MRYLILGSSGMAGHMVALYLQEQGHEVWGFAHHQEGTYPVYIGDATNNEELYDALGQENFDYVINCIGVLNQAVDRNLAKGIYINSVLPHLIAERLQQSETKLIHISTDCVFSGKKGTYSEIDQPDAETMYGRSKSLGEVIDNKNLTIRTSIVGPELKPDGIGLFHWFMRQTEEIQGYAKVIWSGVTTLQLAKAIDQMSRIPITGLYHLVNNQVISKYNLLQLFNTYCRQKPIEIKKNVDIINDKSLINSRKDYRIDVPDYECMIKEMAEWMREHKKLYSQYAIF